MFEAFYQQLIINKKVTLPGLGTLTLSRTPAQLNFAQKTFTAPEWVISFVKGNAIVDQKIYALVAQMQGIDEEEAIKRVDKYVFDIKREFSVYKKLELPKIGLLTENNEGAYELKNENRLYQYFPDIAAERVVRENGDKSIFEDAGSTFTDAATHTNETLDDASPNKHEWWIDAIILTILAIAAIAYYYFQNGSFR